MKTSILLISGKMGSGKSTVARMLLERAWPVDAQLFKFADVLYSMHNRLLMELRGYNVSVPKKDGKLLQLLGTDWGRAVYGENVWVDICKRRVNQWLASGVQRLAIIDDCRFPNELEAFPNALKVRLEAPADVRKQRCDAWRDDVGHASECALDGHVEGGFDRVYNAEVLSAAEITTDILRLLGVK